MDAFFTQFSIFELSVFALIILTFLVQTTIWFGYSLIATHRQSGKIEKGSQPPAITIVVVIQEDYDFIDNALPELLAQQYAGQWEVVVVNDCGGSDVSNSLDCVSLTNPKLRHTTLCTDDHFKHSRKIPLLVGIKSAHYPNILIADPTAVPASNKWLTLMARGFVDSAIVIGYTGFVDGTNRIIRASRLMLSMRYLKAAVVGNPYRGIYNNIGYTKESFFKGRGYTHLRLTLGEDDLFIQKLAPYCATSVVISPTCAMRQTPYGGLRWWFSEERYRTFSFKFYPFKVKFAAFFDLATRALFVAAVVVCSFFDLPYIWGYGAGIFLLREAIVWWNTRRVMRRLGERHLMVTFLIYELFAPITQSVLTISRRISPAKGLWK
ncbi:MAG: hypothetical protein RR354_02155 [Mucinivorans sp.]